jgi:hypothetical protein
MALWADEIQRHVVAVFDEDLVARMPGFRNTCPETDAAP